MRKSVLPWIFAVFLLLVAAPTAAASDQAPKLVALTFDDGPCQYTERLLDGLAERGAKATFFVQGCKAEQNPDVIRRMITEGHQVGNHAYDHPNLSQLPLNDAIEQLIRTNSILDEITGGVGGYAYRAPYGSSTPAIREKLDAPFYKWSVDTVDWAVKHAWTIQNTLIDKIHDGAIILAHDTVFQTTDAVLMAIECLQECGYEFVTINELYRRRGCAVDRGCGDEYECLPNFVCQPMLERPVITMQMDEAGVTVFLESESNVPIYYSTDDSPILLDGAHYTGPFRVTLPCTIRAVAAENLNGSRSEETLLVISQEREVYEKETDPNECAYLTRGLLAQLLYDIEEEHCVQACEVFEDVSVDHPYADAIAWSYASGIFDGTDAIHFQPNLQISREEVAKVLAAMLKLDSENRKTDYADEDEISEWAYTSVCAVTEHGLMRGYADGNFNPQGVMTGYEIEMVLQRLRNIR